MRASLGPLGPRLIGRSNNDSFLRSVFCPSRGEMVNRFEGANRRLWMHFLGAAGIAAVLYQLSTLSPLIITAWLIGLMAVDTGIYLTRRAMIKRQASCWDISIFIAVNVVACSAWCVMPLVLEFRTPPEQFIGLLALMAILISAIVVAMQVQIWLINLVLVGGAMLAPDFASLVGPGPRTTAMGVIIIKLLFLFNVTTLARHWHAGAKREAAMQAEIAVRRKQAEDLAGARSMYLAHMSHEIRSPLAGVTLLASVLKRLENVPEDQRRMIDQIDAGSQAILNTLNSVLDYSKIEAGKLTLSPAPTDVRAMLGNVAGFFQLPAREGNTQFLLSLAPVLPARLMLDGPRLQQVVTNLVSNAVTSSPGATVELKAGYESGVLWVEVVDTGQGLNKEMQKHLFTPHRQPAGNGSGTGLGLAVSRGLVTLMGGQIGYRETPGGGATLWFNILASQVG